WAAEASPRRSAPRAPRRRSAPAGPSRRTTAPRTRLRPRQTRLRLEAEVVRDVALATSGLLSRTIGGPSVFPPQPQGVYSFTQVPRTWTADTGANRYRRGMYTHFLRSAPHPRLTAFHAPHAPPARPRPHP